MLKINILTCGTKNRRSELSFCKKTRWKQFENSATKTDNVICIACRQSKQSQLSFKSEGYWFKSSQEVVPPIWFSGASYIITVLDNYSKKMYEYAFSEKSLIRYENENNLLLKTTNHSVKNS